ncbi:hypothetical protein [Streptomyces litchfieldiae]|uniref:Uncharacterized protein n=1 Tax=Streptomyces litchfieldiae TaxID=3075543 RepID=A0ABU2MRZ9_9ACTN|nr:hypothetical protein [Streptomyces sp. DSM 44938]MDT0343874.1 hypothetical protein [Streptomyces sp. DSM 44938]
MNGKDQDAQTPDLPPVVEIPDAWPPREELREGERDEEKKEREETADAAVQEPPD